MIKLRPYRWYRCILGARSFVKNHDDGSVSYMLVRSSSKNFLKEIIEMGFVEEWKN